MAKKSSFFATVGNAISRFFVGLGKFIYTIWERIEHLLIYIIDFVLTLLGFFIL